MVAISIIVTNKHDSMLTRGMLYDTNKPGNFLDRIKKSNETLGGKLQYSSSNRQEDINSA